MLLYQQNFLEAETMTPGVHGLLRVSLGAVAVVDIVIGNGGGLVDPASHVLMGGKPQEIVQPRGTTVGVHCEVLVPR